MSVRSVLWWGRSDIYYSRNSIIRKQFQQTGWEIIDFSPRLSAVAGLEATLRNFKNIDLVWVPCFRQRDLQSAANWCKAKNVPLIFDPLISSYDKQINERQKFPAESSEAKALLQWEAKLFLLADLVIADTQAHADFFSSQFGVAQEKTQVIYVSADESMFSPSPQINRKESKALDVLFYGSYVHLQGPDTIIQAVSKYQGPEVKWTLLGDGALRKDTEALANELGVRSVYFEDWLDYQELPKRIQDADIILGIFGDTPKAGRVIPNKVFQAMAMGKPIVTQPSSAYPAAVQDCKGLRWVTAGEPTELADAVAALAKLTPEALSELGQASRQTYEKHLSWDVSAKQFAEALQKVNFMS